MQRAPWQCKGMPDRDVATGHVQPKGLCVVQELNEKQFVSAVSGIRTEAALSSDLHRH